MKKFTALFPLIALFLVLAGQVFAQSTAPLTRDQAIAAYSKELVSIGLDKASADAKAGQDVGAVIAAMKQSQSDVSFGFDSIENRVGQLLQTDKRKKDADKALETAKKSKKTFVDDFKAENNLYVQESLAGAPPAVMASDEFTLAQTQAENDQNLINRSLIGPSKPGATPAGVGGVPEGDLITDFIPQVIRQLFRFAWLAVLVALTASGIMLVMAHDDDAKLTKAKSMIYYTLIGTAFVSLAFALVKAVTNIDFFFISK